VFWPGTHFEDMDLKIGQIFRKKAEPKEKRPMTGGISRNRREG
jgi:hypothetical protein